MADVPEGLTCRVALVLGPAAIAVLPLPRAEELLDCAVGGVRSVRRRQVLIALARRVFGEASAPMRLVVGANGVRRLGSTPYFASVAERAGWVAAAISPTPIGIDIEQRREAEAAATMVLDQVDTVDLAAWHGLAGVWAAREATLKAMGCDLTSPPRRWRFADGSAALADGPPHRVDLIARADLVVALAYVGG